MKRCFCVVFICHDCPPSNTQDLNENLRAKQVFLQSELKSQPSEAQ